MNINVAMKRIAKQIKHDDEFKPSTVSIREMCELHDGQKYFNQIRNRIYRELDQNLDMGDYIYINLEDKEDIRLTGDGVFIFFEILTGYFDENHVRDLCMYLCRKNRYEEKEYQLAHSFDGCTVPELKKLKETYSKYEAKNADEEAAKKICLGGIDGAIKKHRGILLKFGGGGAN